jgi:hypothetical protein
MKLGIQIALLVGIVALSYLVFNSINSRITFERETARRKAVVVERLKDIRTAQLTYKNIKGTYADNFDSLIDFVRNGKMPIVRQIGDASDSLQVAQGLVIRDTSYINIIDTLFSPSQMENRLRIFKLDSIAYIPYSGGEKFAIAAGEIEKNRVKVKVFEVSASYKHIYKGLNAEEHFAKLEEELKVGSMTDPSTSGNWE